VAVVDNEALLKLVYDDLRARADALMRHERGDHTLQATALVHEAWLRLVDRGSVGWEDKTHFFAVAARALRRVLVDHARTRRRDKRGGGAPRLPFNDEMLAAYEDAVDLVAMDDALAKLHNEDEEAARIVELRFFGGLGHDEIATVLDVSTRTVERRWRFARAWLFRALADATTDSDR
jgi:RNA polymerase sigma factor (TIGR02999 family)